jgi:hypothetical protein
VLAHFADQLGHGIPVLIATGIVELLQVVRGLGCVGLDYGCKWVSSGCAAPIKYSRYLAKTWGRIDLLTMLAGLQANSHYDDLLKQDMGTDDVSGEGLEIVVELVVYIYPGNQRCRLRWLCIVVGTACMYA